MQDNPKESASKIYVGHRPYLMPIQMDCIAPYLWNRGDHLQAHGIDVIKSADSLYNDFNMNLDDISELPALLHRTANTLRKLIDSFNYRVYIVDEGQTEIHYLPAENERPPEEKKTWKMRMSRTIAAHVACTKEGLLVSEVYADYRFPEHTGWPEQNLTSVMCVPVMGMNEECCALFEFTQSTEQFEQHDFDILTIVIGWLGSSIEQYQKRLLAKQTEELSAKLQRLMCEYTADQTTFDSVIDEFMTLLKAAICAEQIQMYLMDHTGDSLECRVYVEAGYKARAQFLPKKLKVTLTGIPLLAYQELIPVYNVAADREHASDSRTDHKTGVVARSVLCVPIVTRSGRCQAIIHATNKLSAGGDFTMSDENTIATVFARCCSTLIGYKVESDLTQLSIASNTIHNEFLMNRLHIRYVAKPLLIGEGKSLSSIPNFGSFKWYPDGMTKPDLIHLAYEMIADVCGGPMLVPETAFVYVITICKMHRPLPVHDFEHSFVCLHTVYCILKHYGDRFDSIEKMSMMLGSLCRNIEHTGCSNALLRFTKHPLSIMHEYTCLQNHQFWLAKLLIKNTEVLDLIDKEQEKRFIEYLGDFMLASELQWHMRRYRTDLEVVCGEDPNTQQCRFDWTDQRHHRLLRGLISTVSNLSMYCKPYRVASKLSQRQMNEMFTEGDAVRSYGLTPIPHMDRRVAWRIPEWHEQLVRFLLPCFELLRNVLPVTDELREGAVLLCKSWKEVIDARGQKVWTQDDSWSR